MTRWVETFQRSMIIAKCIPVFSTVFSSSVHTNFPNTFNLIGFSISWLNVPDEGYSERTWWRLFWTYLMKVIPECTWWRLLWMYLMKVIMSVPDEGYYERTWWRLLWMYLMKVIPERTRWRLFLNIPDEDYSWTYLMTATIPHKFNIVRFQRHFICR